MLGFVLLADAVLALLAGLTVRAVFPGHRAVDVVHKGQPMDILASRYARGELSGEQYALMRGDLECSARDAHLR
ncbi:MAG: hypothetical protein ACYC4R_03765 [Anaerolineae bacterium]